MQIVLNEIEYAENALAQRVLGDKPYDTLCMVGKYYRSKGYGTRDISRMLTDFLMQCDPSVNIVRWQDMIDHIAKDASKRKPIVIDGVPITQTEMDICRSVGGVQAQRLLFTLICLAKYSDMVRGSSTGWLSMEDRDIFRLANIVTPVVRQSIMLSDLRDCGVIGFSKKVDNISIRVKCIDNEQPPTLLVTDFRNLGYRYLMHNGGPYFECSVCGIVVRKGSNASKYCRECAADMNRQKTLSNWYRSSHSTQNSLSL